MNLKKAVKTLGRVFKEWGLDFTVTLEADKDRVRATNELTIDGHDDHVFADFRFYDGGAAEYLFTFDKLERNAETLALVNSFNEEIPWFKAYIDDEYLRLSHVVCNLTEDNLADYTSHILSDLVDEDVKAKLIPLTVLTVD